ncbi:MAG: amidohydrolase family protein [Myxococcota bacterium]
MGVALCGGTVVDLNPVHVAMRDVVLEDGHVVDRAPNDDDERVDCTGCVIWPGMVCAHTHLYSGLARGMPLPKGPTRSFVEILEQVWWKMDCALDEESLRMSVFAASMEALRAGTTTLFDHHESPRFIDGSLDIIADALRQVGLRGVLCYGATDRHGDTDGQRGIAECKRFIERIKGDRMLRGLVGLHAPFTVGPETLAAAVDAMKATSTGIHVHVAEALSDEVHSATKYNMPAVTRLSKAGALGPLSLVAHAVHVDEAEIRELARTDTPVIHNVRSNLNNAVGYQQPKRFKSMVTLGTDGMDGDMITEGRAVFHNGRRQYGPTDSVDALALLQNNFKLAERHFGGKFGALQPGYVGDAVVTAYDPPTPLTENTVFGHMFFGPSPWPVRDVVVDAQVVMRGGRFTLVDEAALKHRCRETAQKMWNKLS